jgi:hypothetical protein
MLSSSFAPAKAVPSPEALFGPMPSDDGAIAYAKSQAQQAASFASSCANDAQNITTAINTLKEGHRKVFLNKTFGTNINGKPITVPFDGGTPDNKLNSVNTVEQYAEIIQVLSNWGIG